jgi:heterotetrameric sarcosine oxidase gamma subunit
VNSPFEVPHGALATRRSPLHVDLARQGAQLGVSCGWAYPLWFDRDPNGGSQLNRAVAHASEHRMTREAVGVFDVSLLGQILVIGARSASLLNHLSTNNVDVAIGRVVYTQWCNDEGLIQADVIVARVSADRFMVVVGDTVQERCLEMLEAATAAHRNVHVVDVTSAFAIITIAGPRAEAVMGHLTTENIGVNEFAPMRVRNMVLAERKTIVMTVSYTGERSFEIHVPTEYAASLYTEVSTAAAEEGGGPCGIDAMYSLGTENGSLDYDYDLDGTVTPIEAGLSAHIAWDKPGGFVGQGALDTQRQSGPLRTRIFTVRSGSPEHAFRRGDVVFRDDVVVGYVLSATAGHTVKAHIGMVKLHHPSGITEAWLDANNWHIDHQGKRVRVSLFPGRLHATSFASAARR